MLSKKELDTLELIDYKMYPFLELSGQKDNNGFQIFTPRFIVDNMLKLIGIDFIIDIKKKILEPTSGDGAFTVRILELRLIDIFKNHTDQYLKKSLEALSTIYSIEMDQELLIKQRNNIFTILNYYAKENNIHLPPQYLITAEAIIKDNFVWGESNTNKQHNVHGRAGAIIGWYMPTQIKSVISVPKMKTINVENLFGEHEEMLVPTGEQEQKTKYIYKRINSNRIRFSKWTINNDLTFIKKTEKIELGVDEYEK